MARSDVRATIGIPTYNRAEYLRGSIRSVLDQSYRDFRLVVSDNASTDDTENAVASFDDERIVYSRLDENIGMTPNFNRVLELTGTEYVAVLYDDDLFYPEYLDATVAVLDRYPNVGVVHTAFDVIDRDGAILERRKLLLETSDRVSVESGAAFIERSMHQDWVVCSPSMLFRTDAILAVGGFPVDEDPLPDIPMLRRIALRWDLAFVADPLVAFRVHEDTVSAGLGAFTGLGYDPGADYARRARGQRVRFLDDARLPRDQDRRYRSIAEDTLRRATLRDLARRASSAGEESSVNAELLGCVRSDWRYLVIPLTWRLAAAQLGGRRAKRFLRGVAASLPLDRTGAGSRKA